MNLMLSVAANIVCAVSMYLALKLVSYYKINASPVLFINYIVALSCSLFSYYRTPMLIESISAAFWIPAILLGIIFAVTFMIMALSIKTVGVGLTTAAAKVSLIIPVLIGVSIYGQTQHWPWKLFGLVMVVLAFLFIFSKKSDFQIQNTSALLFPIFVFLFSGLGDSGIDYGQRFCAPTANLKALFLVLVFAASALFMLMISLKSDRSSLLSPKTWMIGLLLGVANFSSSFLMLHNMTMLGSSVFLPIFNASVVVITALTGYYFFKEHLSGNQWFGIALAAIAVAITAAVS